MLKGKKLNQGSTIGIIAPASCDDKDIIDAKINEFAALGFNIKLAPHLYDKYGYLAGKDYCRALDINSMFLDDSVDGIVCFRGGYGCSRCLPFIDSDIIQCHPKFFCGYSDITLLLNYFSKLGLITFHGPMINSDFKDRDTITSFLDICSNNNKNYKYHLNSYKNIYCINKDCFCGKIVGGNLTMICSSLGTKYEIDTNNSILLIEEVGEAPYVVDRMLTQLIQNKKLKNCNGILLGSFKNCDSLNYSRNFTIKEIIEEKLKPLGLPLICNMPFGHDSTNITFPIGVNAEFSPKSMTLTIKDNFLI